MVYVETPDQLRLGIQNDFEQQLQTEIDDMNKVRQRDQDTLRAINEIFSRKHINSIRDGMLDGTEEQQEQQQSTKTRSRSNTGKTKPVTDGTEEPKQ